jgi:sensor histidine kinase YesM
MLCLVVSGRVLIYGDFVFAVMSENFRLMTIIEYLTRYWYPLLLLLLVESEYPGTTHMKFTKAVKVFVLIATCITVVTPIHIFTSSRNILIIFDLSLGLYIIAVLLFRNRNRLRWLAVYTIGMIFMFTVYDMLIPPTSMMELNVVGFYVMMLSFAFILANNYAEALKTKQNTFKELKIVHERERESQLKFLQSQIKPNFLYNTLLAIAGVCSKDSKKAEELILDLALFLQASFDFTGFNRMSTLAQETDFVRNYISIEKVLFTSRLDYHEQIEVPWHTQLPRLVIQPLVENAIRHGLAPKKEGGEVRLLAYEDECGIHIEVWDNGVGMEPDKISNLLNEPNDSQGIGLKNVHERLTKIYGQGLTIDSSPNHWTRVCFILNRTC